MDLLKKIIWMLLQTYFRDKNDIFKEKTKAVYVIVTKSDEIEGDNKVQQAEKFVSENFGGFIGVIKHQCKKAEVDYSVKIFSIGDVYFKGICKMNYYYAENIVENLLAKVKPPQSKSFFRDFFRS